MNIDDLTNTVASALGADFAARVALPTLDGTFPEPTISWARRAAAQVCKAVASDEAIRAVRAELPTQLHDKARLIILGVLALRLNDVMNGRDGWLHAHRDALSWGVYIQAAPPLAARAAFAAARSLVRGAAYLPALDWLAVAAATAEEPVTCSEIGALIFACAATVFEVQRGWGVATASKSMGMPDEISHNFLTGTLTVEATALKQDLGEAARRLADVHFSRGYMGQALRWARISFAAGVPQDDEFLAPVLRERPPDVTQALGVRCRRCNRRECTLDDVLDTPTRCECGSQITELARCESCGAALVYLVASSRAPIVCLHCKEALPGDLYASPIERAALRLLPDGSPFLDPLQAKALARQLREAHDGPQGIAASIYEALSRGRPLNAAAVPIIIMLAALDGGSEVPSRLAFSLADTLRAEKRSAEAVAWLEVSIDLAGDALMLRGEGLLRLGQLLHELQRFETALRAFDRVSEILEMVPDRDMLIDAKHGRAIVLCELGRYGEALALLREHSENDPDFACSVAVVLVRTGHLLEAAWAIRAGLHLAREVGADDVESRLIDMEGDFLTEHREFVDLGSARCACGRLVSIEYPVTQRNCVACGLKWYEDVPCSGCVSRSPAASFLRPDSLVCLSCDKVIKRSNLNQLFMATAKDEGLRQAERRAALRELLATDEFPNMVARLAVVIDQDMISVLDELKLPDDGDVHERVAKLREVACDPRADSMIDRELIAAIDALVANGFGGIEGLKEGAAALALRVKAGDMTLDMMVAALHLMNGADDEPSFRKLFVLGVLTMAAGKPDLAKAISSLMLQHQKSLKEGGDTPLERAAAEPTRGQTDAPWNLERVAHELVCAKRSIQHKDYRRGLDIVAAIKSSGLFPFDVPNNNAALLEVEGVCRFGLGETLAGRALLEDAVAMATGFSNLITIQTNLLNVRIADRDIPEALSLWAHLIVAALKFGDDHQVKFLTNSFASILLAGEDSYSTLMLAGPLFLGLQDPRIDAAARSLAVIVLLDGLVTELSEKLSERLLMALDDDDEDRFLESMWRYLRKPGWTAMERFFEAIERLPDAIETLDERLLPLMFYEQPALICATRNRFPAAPWRNEAWLVVVEGLGALWNNRLGEAIDRLQVLYRLNFSKPCYALPFARLAEACLLRGDLSDAIKHIETARSLAEMGSRASLRGVVAAVRARVALARGWWAEAGDALVTATDVFRRCPLVFAGLFAGALRDKARLHLEFGETLDASRCLDELQVVLEHERCGDRELLAFQAGTLRCLVHAQQGDPDFGIVGIQVLIQQIESSDLNSPWRNIALEYAWRTIAYMASDSRDFDKGEIVFDSAKRAIQLANALRWPLAAAESLRILVELAHQGNIPAVVKTSGKSLSNYLISSSEYGPNAAAVRSNPKNDDSVLLFDLRKAVETVLEALVDSPDAEVVLSLRTSLAGWLLDDDRSREAIEQLDLVFDKLLESAIDGLDLGDSLAQATRFQPVLDSYLAALLRGANTRRCVDVLDRLSLPFVAAVRAVFSPTSGDDEGARAEVIRLLREAIATAGSNIAATSQVGRPVVRQVRRLLKVIERQRTGDGVVAPRGSLQQHLTALSRAGAPAPVYVQFAPLGDGVVCLVTRPGEHEPTSAVITPDSLVKEHIFRDAPTPWPKERVPTSALLDPLLRHTERGELLLVCCYGWLSSIALQTLSIEGTALINRNPVSRVFSSEQLISPAPRRDRGKILMVLDPEENLPGAWLQAAASRADLSARDIVVLAGADATRDALRAAGDGGEFELFVYAGHGSFDADNPLAATLELADGPFSAADLVASRLCFHEAVVAACHSGASSQKRLAQPWGFERALTLCGAQSFVLSAWEASDVASLFFTTHLLRARQEGHALHVAAALAQRRTARATSAVISDFLRELADSDSDSDRRALQALLESAAAGLLPGFTSPSVWGVFQCYGCG